MKEFFEDLGRKIGDTAETLGKKTEEIVEVQKIRNQIRNLERGSERDLMDMGRMIYEKYNNGVVLDAEYVSICENIEAREETIAEYEKEIAEIKGDGLCSECGAPLVKDSQFCPRCGAKIRNEE